MKQTISSPIRKLKLLIVLPLLAGVFYAFAAPDYQFVQTGEEEVTAPQDTKTVKGKVTDESGNPLKSATVVILGKTYGTITDNDGNFMLKVTDDSPIVISYVGFQSLKVKPDFGKEMAITMTMNTVQINLDEKSEISKSETLKIKSDSPLKFRNSDSPENKPLIVIDGVIAKNQNADNIPPENIESMTVLKEEFETSVYGEKGKNGVILITMKKGGNARKNEPIDIKVTQFRPKSKPLVVIDEVIAVNKNIDEIIAETIESMTALTGEDATKKYGEKGKYGAIEIVTKTKDPFVVVEEMPEFPGGEKVLKAFVDATMKYPEIALENGIEGQVYVNFVVAKDGSVTNAKVIRGVDPSLDKEAKRIVESMPKWKPGKQNGENVEVAFTVPINFKLPPEKVSKEKLK